MASSSPIHPKEKYDVFISFRGADTRKTFTSHLHAALLQRKVETYIDYRLERGEEVGSALLKAIEESKISVIILSQDYASSTWCLDELSYILECKDKNGQNVVPVFYEIDPSHVRYQTGNIASALAKHEKRLRLEERMDRVLIWKDALTEVANLSGFDSSSCTVRDDSNLVEQVVEDILTKLNHETVSCDLRGFVGLESRIQQVLLELDIIPEDVRVRSVVIWGMGGIGKTTLADAVFHGHLSQFEACCFLANVREESKTKGAVSPNLYKLRDKMVRKLLGDETLTMETPTLPRFVRVRLERMKVLLVLDDVDDIIQLEFLAGDKVPFGPGSRILITTRDLKRATEMQVVRKGANHDVKIYNCEKLNNEESLQLFYPDALRDICSSTNLEVILSRVVDSAAGIPLALKIWHSLFIHCTSIQEMEDVWNTMKRFPIKKLQNVYRVSYEVLEENEREIFLDIACFHKGKSLPEAKRLLDACGFLSDNGIKCLIDISLISVKRECLWMHDVIQEMGWEIVKAKCLEEPGKRSRLFAFEDVRHVLENATGTANVQGISLELSDSDDRVYLSPPAFTNMYRLRFLRLSNHASQVDQLDSLPNALAYLSWYEYPLFSLPISFSPHKLVELHMPKSNLQRLWSNKQNPRSLKRIDLHDSIWLIDVSGLSKCVNIESINLGSCYRLHQVPSCFKNFTRLTYLNLEGCSNIRSLPEMPSKMEILNLQNSGLEKMCRSVCGFTKIKNLWLNCSKFREFPEIQERTECLECLWLNATGIQELPRSINNLVGLKELNSNCCRNLESVPSSIYNLKNLQSLSLSGCSKLEKLPPSSVILCPLISLNLSGCSSLEEIPDTLITLTSLQCLDLSGTKIQFMPPMKDVSGLRRLVLDNCDRLQSLTELPCLLEWLDVDGCISLKTVSFSMTALTHDGLRLLGGMKGFHSFGDCFNLDESARSNIMNDAQLRILRNAIAFNLECRDRSEDKKYSITVVCPGNEIPKWFSCQKKYSVTVVCPGNEIPKWFSCQTEGSLINIKLPLHWSDDINFLGFAFCLVSKYTTYSVGQNVKLIFKTNDGTHCHIDSSMSYGVTNSSDHVYVWYKAIELSNAMKLSTEVFVDFEFDTVVERCGVCFLYYPGQDNALKFEVIGSERW